MQQSKFNKFFAIVLAAVVLNASLGAATSGTVNLSGVVPAILEVSVTATSAAGNLNLVSVVSDLQIATVVERSNKRAGYKITLSSANAAAQGASAPFFSSAGSADTLSYAISYNGAPVTFAGGAAAEVTDASAKTAALGASKPVTISYDGTGSFLDEGTYTDVLTFTIIAK